MMNILDRILGDCCDEDYAKTNELNHEYIMILEKEESYEKTDMVLIDEAWYQEDMIKKVYFPDFSQPFYPTNDFNIFFGCPADFEWSTSPDMLCENTKPTQLTPLKKQHPDVDSDIKLTMSCFLKKMLDEKDIMKSEMFVTSYLETMTLNEKETTIKNTDVDINKGNAKFNFEYLDVD